MSPPGHSCGSATASNPKATRRRTSSTLIGSLRRGETRMTFSNYLTDSTGRLDIFSGGRSPTSLELPSGRATISRTELAGGAGDPIRHHYKLTFSQDDVLAEEMV